MYVDKILRKSDSTIMRLMNVMHYSCNKIYCLVHDFIVIYNFMLKENYFFFK